MGVNIMQNIKLNLIIVSNQEKFNANIEKFISHIDIEHAEYNFVNSICLITKFIKADYYNLLIINKKEYIISEFDFLLDNNMKNIGSLIIVDKDNYLKVFNKLYKSGFIVVSTPLSVSKFIELIKLNLLSIKKKIKYELDLKKYEETKIIDIAKSLLIVNERKNEEEAHKYIEKLSMDLRKPLIKTAEYIISEYI